MPKDLKTYHIPARWEFVGTAYVEAENEEDAIHRFERCEGVVFDRLRAEMVNWEAEGDPELDE